MCVNREGALLQLACCYCCSKRHKKKSLPPLESVSFGGQPQTAHVEMPQRENSPLETHAQMLVLSTHKLAGSSSQQQRHTHAPKTQPFLYTSVPTKQVHCILALKSKWLRRETHRIQIENHAVTEAPIDTAVGE